MNKLILLFLICIQSVANVSCINESEEYEHYVYSIFEEEVVSLDGSEELMLFSNGKIRYEPKWNKIGFLSRITHEIILIDINDYKISKFGGLGKGPNEMGNPSWLTIDSNSRNVIVYDEMNSRANLLNEELKLKDQVVARPGNVLSLFYNNDKFLLFGFFRNGKDVYHSALVSSQGDVMLTNITKRDTKKYYISNWLSNYDSMSNRVYAMNAYVNELIICDIDDDKVKYIPLRQKTFNEMSFAEITIKTEEDLERIIQLRESTNHSKSNGLFSRNGNVYYSNISTTNQNNQKEYQYYIESVDIEAKKIASFLISNDFRLFVGLDEEYLYTLKTNNDKEFGQFTLFRHPLASARLIEH